MYYVMNAEINVWNPQVQEQNGFSLAQFWLAAVDNNGVTPDTIEASTRHDKMGREFLLRNELGVEILKGLFEIGDGFERGADFVGGQEVGGLSNELFEVGNGGGDAVEVRSELSGIGESSWESMERLESEKRERKEAVVVAVVVEEEDKSDWLWLASVLFRV
uniref:Uncharacterized protein n=1 Tax=Quercus lobata TaxID=97700 RepID=A0A7N2LBX6_QUELO